MRVTYKEFLAKKQRNPSPVTQPATKSRLFLIHKKENVMTMIDARTETYEAQIPEEVTIYRALETNSQEAIALRKLYAEQTAALMLKGVILGQE